MPTIAELKFLYQSKLAPGDDEAFLALMTEADTKLLEAVKYQWCKKRETLTSVNGIVTLPITLASILGAHLDGFPATVSAEDYEFNPEGPGEIDVDGGVNVRLIDQGLNESSGLREYKVVGCDGDELTIVALCLKAPAVLYDPDVPDSDLPAHATTETICPSAPALKLAGMAIHFEDGGDNGSARSYMHDAYTILSNRETSQRGGAQQTPNIRPNGRGIKSIRTFR